MDDRTRMARVELAAARAWPATHARLDPDGWLLRATPGLRRGRSNNALTPCRPLSAAEIASGLARVRAFAAAHGVPAGIQVTPLAEHDALQRALDALRWTRQPPVLVLTGPAGERHAPPPQFVVSDHASPGWLAAWARCEPERDHAAHAATVFPALRGRAMFTRVGTRAVGIAVPSGPLVGMFCVAVEPDDRRAGLATALVRAMLAATPASLAYLQVEEHNTAAVGLYERLGFAESHRYGHRTEPS